MNAVAADRNLLFGLLALQNGLIDQAQLAGAFQAWTLDRTRGLSGHLIARGDLDTEQAAGVDVIVALHLKKYGGDPEKSVAALPDARSTCESLLRSGEAGAAAIGRTGLVSTRDDAKGDGDADRTGSFAYGSATSDGQRFHVLRPHARGGLGAVFVARDAELNREVALKQILESHADDPASRARFLLEAEVTGGLEHPGIVPVYGLGTYGDGRPYYAMRFIRGESLKDAIDRFHAGRASASDASRRSLALRLLLRRFVDVCNAIEYAHSRGVLHRDIKPSNIVVGKHGETLVVDWGLAKPMGRSDPSAGERTLLPNSASGSSETLPGSALGTPSYMSPEQADGDLERLGTASDVYSLGATLYCLLTGVPPFGGEAIDVVPRVKKGDFRPPRQVNRTIDRALEAICLKAMAVQPADRYASAHSLAEDVERWMAEEPVSAWSEPLSRRARRWARKHRTAVAGAAGLLVTSTMALAVSTVLISRERNEAQTQRLEAEAQALQARQAVHLLTEVADVGSDERLDPVQKDFLENALAYYQKFISRTSADPVVQFEHGRASQQMGDIERKLGHLPEAERAYRKAIDLLEPLARPAGTGREARQALARTRTLLGDLLVRRGADSGQAEPLYNQALQTQQELANDPKAGTLDRLRHGQTLKSLADLLRLNGQFKKAASVYDQAVAVLGQAHAGDPKDNECRHVLALAIDHRGWVHRELGDLKQAEQDFRRAMELLDPLVAAFPTVPGYRAALAKACNSLGLIEESTGRLVDAESHFRRELPMVERLFQDFPDRPEYGRQLARTLSNLGNVLSSDERSTEAEQTLRRAIEVNGAVAARSADDVQIQLDLAKAFNNLGHILRQKGDSRQAITLFQKARTINEALVKQVPDKPRYRANLAGCLENLGLALEDVDDPRWEETFQAALAIDDELVARYPDNIDYRIDQARCLRNFGALVAEASRPDQAEAIYRRALALLGPGDDRDRSPQLLRLRASLLINLGVLQTDNARPGAEDTLRSAIATFERLVGGGSSTLEDRRFLAIAQNNMGDLFVKLGRFAEAGPYLTGAVSTYEKLVAAAPKSLELQSEFGQILETQAKCLAGAGKPSDARTAFENAVLHQREAMRLSRNRTEIRRLLVRHLIDLAGMDIQLGAFKEAADLALEVPQVVPTAERGQGCHDAARILARLVTQVSADTRLEKAERDKLARNYLGRTIVLVRDAIDSKPELEDRIKNDPDIKLLESRPEFRTIMTTLDKLKR